MKNKLKTATYILVFALAGVFFQISCSNDDASFQNAVVTPTSGKLIYTKQSSGNQPAIWTSNYDGTNQTQVTLSLPANVELSTINNNAASVKISPDGQKIFFVAYNTSTNLSSVYSCDLDGNNLVQVIAPTSSEIIELGGLN